MTARPPILINSLTIAANGVSGWLQRPGVRDALVDLMADAIVRDLLNESYLSVASPAGLNRSRQVTR
jgi:hypothetical protein